MNQRSLCKIVQWQQRWRFTTAFCFPAEGIKEILHLEKKLLRLMKLIQLHFLELFTHTNVSV